VTRDDIVNMLQDENPEALLADGFEAACIGLARRCGQPTILVYDYRLGLDVLMNRDGMSSEEAVEWMEFNVVGAWAGEHTPTWLVRGPFE